MCNRLHFRLIQISIVPPSSEYLSKISISLHCYCQLLAPRLWIVNDFTKAFNELLIERDVQVSISTST